MDDKCPGCTNVTDEEGHGCPYAEEIDGDFEYTCNCCSDCTDQCAMDI